MTDPLVWPGICVPAAIVFVCGAIFGHQMRNRTTQEVVDAAWLRAEELGAQVAALEELVSTYEAKIAGMQASLVASLDKRDRNSP